VYSPECRFGTAAISTINTNKKRISKLQNKETESADEGQEVEETGNTVWWEKRRRQAQLYHEENQYVLV
jgi:hypothetical protein